MKHLEEIQEIWSIQRNYIKYEAFRETTRNMKHSEKLQQIWSIQRNYNKYEAFRETTTNK